jgi:hypothetical protein
MLSRQRSEVFGSNRNLHKRWKLLIWEEAHNKKIFVKILPCLRMPAVSSGLKLRRIVLWLTWPATGIRVSIQCRPPRQQSRKCFIDARLEC